MLVDPEAATSIGSVIQSASGIVCVIFMSGFSIVVMIPDGHLTTISSIEVLVPIPKLAPKLLIGEKLLPERISRICIKPSGACTSTLAPIPSTLEKIPRRFTLT